MITIEITPEWRVRARAEFDVPLSAPRVWGQMRDWKRFLTIDPLHARARVTGAGANGSPLGARVVIEHRLLGAGPDRIGRVLKWREGRGFAISDLSRRGPRVGFPHVCAYDVAPGGPRRSRITFRATGRWTAVRWPRAAVRLWLWWVLRSTQRRIEADMTRLLRWAARSERERAVRSSRDRFS